MSKNNRFLALLFLSLTIIYQSSASDGSFEYSITDEEVLIQTLPSVVHSLHEMPISERKGSRVDLVRTQGGLNLKAYVFEPPLPIIKTPHNSHEIMNNDAPLRMPALDDDAQALDALELRTKLFAVAAERRAAEMHFEGRIRSSSMDQITRSPTVYLWEDEMPDKDLFFSVSDSGTSQDSDEF